VAGTSASGSAADPVARPIGRSGMTSSRQSQKFMSCPAGLGPGEPRQCSMREELSIAAKSQQQLDPRYEAGRIAT